MFDQQTLKSIRVPPVVSDVPAGYIRHHRRDADGSNRDGRAPLSVPFVLYVPSLPEICHHPRNLRIKNPCPSGSLRGLTSKFKINTPSHCVRRKSSFVNSSPSSLCTFASPKSLIVSPSPSTSLKVNEAKRPKKILIFFAVIYTTYHWEIMQKPAKKCRRIVAKTRNL